LSEWDFAATLPFKIIDTNTSNVIKTREGSIGLNSITLDYEKQYYTLTKIRSYTGKSVVYMSNSNNNSERIADVSIMAVI
jgi:hypothetical protein